MMTQIKQWLQKLISWLRGWEEPEPADAPIEHTSRGISVDPLMHSSLDDTFPWQGVAPGSQGEPRRSTIDVENWRTPDPLISPYSPAPDEDWETENPFSEPERENTLPPAENTFSPRSLPAPPPSPAPVSPAPVQSEAEQHLEFLRYLVERGIVNEGFPEDQTPEQYRK